MTLLLGAVTVCGRPALRGVLPVKQPDGTTISLRLNGDEYLHYTTTADGYALVKNASGFYVYAQLDADGQLAPTAIVAHDAAQRSQQEKDYIAQAGRIVPRMTDAMAQMRQQNGVAQARAQQQLHAQRYDYSRFKGLVILIEYNDRPFRYDDYDSIMYHMLNDDDYTGTTRTNFQDRFSGSYVTCTGSMRDFFRDNSSGVFVPTFDVVGPVKVDHSQYEGRDNTRQILIDACTAADSLVNFKDYDIDNDHKVDMIYFIVSGEASYIQGNDERLLWPHQYDLTYYGNVYKDGVRLGRYACSTELFSYQMYNWSILEGIGTMCHEFSHVLGLPDFYDTGNTDQRECVEPGNWSIMSSGADYDYGRRPCGYSLFERYALGFATPQLISEPGSYAIEDLSQSNTGYRINSQKANEYFMLENRQHVKWDAKLPGHGMLVFRVDSTNTDVWIWSNAVNDNPDHPYYELIRANGYRNDDTSSDPFPGTARVTRLDNETSPAHLRSWTGKNTVIGLSDIAEQDGVVTFDAFDAFQLQGISTASSVSLGVGTSLQLTTVCKPTYVSTQVEWSTSDPQVCTISSDGLVSGIAPGTATVTVTANGTFTATCDVTVQSFDVCHDIHSFLQMDEGSSALLQLCDAQVLYVSKQDIYLRDATGTIILNGTKLNVQQNDILNGTIYGQYTLRNQMPLLKADATLTRTDGYISNPGSVAQPISLHMSQLNSGQYANMVTIRKAALVKDGGIYAVWGDKRIRLYNTLGIKSIKVPTDLSKRYDITAIFGTNTLNDQVIDEFYLLSSPTAVSYTQPTDIALDTDLRLPEGRQYQLQPTITPAKADVFLSWQSSDTLVATVSADGLVTTLQSGNVVITVTDLDSGLSAQCSITVGDRIVKDDIASFMTLSPGGEADLVLTNAQVTYVYKNDAYVRDASGAIRFASTGLNLNAGDVLNGRVYGTYTISDLVPELHAIEGSTTDASFTVVSGQDVTPRLVNPEELSESDMADYITVSAVQLGKNTGLPGIYMIAGEKRVRLYNTFKLKNITVPSDYEGKFYDVTGILITSELGGQTVWYLALTTQPVELQELSAITDVLTLPHPTDIYTVAGRKVRSQATTAAGLPKGIYIMDGKKIVIQ